MNQYLIYLNGKLVSHELFEVVTGTAPNDGRFAELRIGPENKIADRVKELDVLEVRASNIVRRYRFDIADGVKKSYAGDDHTPARVGFRAMSVKNSF